MSNTVAVGQVWADNDPRNDGRVLRVELADCWWVLLQVITPAYSDLDMSTTGQSVSIPTSRMEPTKTGFRLIRDADGTLIEALP